MYRDEQEDEINRFFKAQERGFDETELEESQPVPYVDEKERMRRQIEHEEKVARCSVFAKKYMYMFLILIGNVAFSVITFVITALALANPGIRSGIAVLLIVIAVISFVTALLYGVILFSLGNFYDDFRKAGLLYIFYGACDAIASSTSGGIALLFQIISAVASVMYMLKFATAMSASFDNVASYMAISWESFRKVFIYLYAAIVMCTVVSFFPVLGIFAAFFLLLLSLAAIGVSIWQIILVKRSSSVMKEHANSIFAG